MRYASKPMPDARLRLHRLAANSQLAPLFSIKLLCMLSKADMIGRKSSDLHESLERIAYCEGLAREEGCYARAHIVYLETTWQNVLSRNKSRQQAVPQAAIEKMLDKTVLPEEREAQTVDWYNV